MRHFVEIHMPGAPAERHEIVGSEARIGSGAGCSIKPTRSEAFLPEHVRLVPSDTGCRVSLLPGVRGPLLYSGAPQWEVVVPWGDEVFLDGTRFTLLSDGGQSKRPSTVLLAAAGVILALTAAAFVRSPDSRDVTAHEIEPPVLLKSAGTCQETDSNRAQAVAEQTERSAFAKEERSAFAVSDAAQALALLRDAEACYRVAGDTADSERLHAEFVRWMGRTSEDYAATRLRLRLALDHQRWPEAHEAVEHLEALLVGHAQDPYTDWLHSLRNELERRISAGGRR